MTPPPTHVARARTAAGPPAALEVDRSPDAIAARLEDAAHYPGGHAEAVARPRSEADVAGLVRSASRVLVIGAQSSVTGGATPDGGLVLSTDRLVTFHETGQHRYRVGAGMPLETLQKLLHERGRWYAPVPTFLGAFVGGVAATNAAGAATFKYGTTRAWVEGLTVVMACGCVLELERGAAVAHPAEGWVVECACGRRRARPGSYRVPDVPKCSAGYYAAPDMDLIDLFVGSEGTLGVVTDVTLRTIPVVQAAAMAAIFATSESEAIAFVDDVRRASQATWRESDRHGIDVAAIEQLDRRCLEVLAEDGMDARCRIDVPTGTEVLLLLQLELEPGTTTAGAFDAVARALEPDAPDSSLARLARLLASRGWLDRTELALPGDARRSAEFLAFREGAPAGVNRRVGDARRDIDPRIDKTAADMIVPFDDFGEMMVLYRDGFARRGLDCAIWGHVSDGNVHPNLIPSSWHDVELAREAILEFGRAVIRRGGSPLAEHGVGRSALKQALLRELYGHAAIEDMRSIKRVFDPDWKLAPGVLLGPRP